MEVAWNSARFLRLGEYGGTFELGAGAVATFEGLR